MDLFTIGIIVIILILIGILLIPESKPVEQKEIDQINEDLQEEFDPAEFKQAPELDKVEKVAENYQTGEPIIKPVVAFSIDEEEPEDPMDMYPVAHRALRKIHTSFDEQVRCFEVQVGHKEGVHRIQARPGDVAGSGENWRELEKLVSQHDTKDPEIPPIWWEKIAEPSDSSSAAVTAAAAASASASAGSCGGAAGGAC